MAQIKIVEPDVRRDLCEVNDSSDSRENDSVNDKPGGCVAVSAVDEEFEQEHDQQPVGSMHFHIKEVESKKNDDDESAELDHVHPCEKIADAGLHNAAGLHDGGPFHKGDRTHAGDPSGDLPGKSESIKKCMTDQSAKRGGDPHGDEEIFEIDDSPQRAACAMKAVCGKEAYCSHHQVGKRGDRLLYL